MGNNTYNKSYLDTQALTEAKLDNSFQSLQPDLAQTALLTTNAVANQVLTATIPGSAATWQTPADPKGPFAVRNYGLSATTSSGSLIVTLKTAAGTNPTASDIVDITFSSNGTTSAVPQKFQQTSSLTLSVTASATLGVLSASTGTLYVYGVQVSSSTLRLAISTSGTFDDGTARATTLMASTADTAGVLYSNATASTYPVRLLGWIKASHTSGSWNNIYKVNLTNTGPNNANSWVYSSSSGSFTTNSGTFVDITNMTVTITSTGRPIVIQLVSDGTTGTAFVQTFGSGTSNGVNMKLVANGSTNLGIVALTNSDGSGSGNNTTSSPPAVFTWVDNPAAGTNTYKLQGTCVGAGSNLLSVINCRLLAYEI